MPSDIAAVGALGDSVTAGFGARASSLIDLVIEARGAERFGLIADAASDEPIKRFYTSISRSEERHRTLFTDLACRYFPGSVVDARLGEWLDIEAEIASSQPLRAALH